ncbi:MAG: 4'-phosphopantetheinyl transferase superfamily protein [Oscillospiraceae bacterium]|nr:4'-phosphopantetheinyl transferase superfamily protein [Oscillospiraceae bacterium]
MQLYICDIKPFLDLKGLALITKERQKRIHRYLRIEDKARSLVAGLLLRRVCGITDDEQIVFGKNGKPYLRSNGGRSKQDKVYFNISHSGDYVILAIADREIGVDIEQIAPYSNAIAHRCFTPAEQEWLKQKGDDKSFFRLWTAKESVMKATGLGFALSPNSFCVLPLDSSVHYINKEGWRMEWFFHDGYIVCCCVKHY